MEGLSQVLREDSGTVIDHPLKRRPQTHGLTLNVTQGVRAADVHSTCRIRDGWDVVEDIGMEGKPKAPESDADGPQR